MRNRLAVLFLFALLLSLTQCQKDSVHQMPETDAALFAKATAAGYSYYKNDSTVRHSSPQSAHGAYFRVRFNSIAQAALTDQGKLPAGGSFPTGSIIVKELHGDTTGSNIGVYAIMEKLPADTSQADGWIWAEVNTSGAGYTINNKGAICTGCHSVDDRDKVRLFDIFP